jgi:hypothetical protein
MTLIIINFEFKIINSRHIVFKISNGTQLDRLGYQQKQTIKINNYDLSKIKART